MRSFIRLDMLAAIAMLNSRPAETSTQQQEITLAPADTVPHYYGGCIRKIRKFFRLDPSLKKEMCGIYEVKHVHCSYARHYDRNKFSGTILRDIRQRNGCGRPPKQQAAA